MKDDLIIYDFVLEHRMKRRGGDDQKRFDLLRRLT